MVVSAAPWWGVEFVKCSPAHPATPFPSPPVRPPAGNLMMIRILLAAFFGFYGQDTNKRKCRRVKLKVKSTLKVLTASGSSLVGSLGGWGG